MDLNIMSILWVEKYRPINLNEISSQEHVINSLRKTLFNKNIPHLIFFGPAGCGKTSTIIALAKELFKTEYSNRVIELNASDERGINVVREKIKIYAKQTITNKNDIPPWKLIILDEADTMTSDSQCALRRIMEEYSKITRFCIIGNYCNKIIDPIVSRCALFRFKPINQEHILKKLKYICNQENFNISLEILNKIIKISRGDLRKAINLLQNYYNIFQNNFNMTLLNEFSGFIPKEIFNNLIENIYNKNYNNVDNIINKIILDGYSLVLQISLFHNYILNTDKLSSIQKSNIMIKLAEVDQNLIEGCDEYISFYNLVYFIMINI
jgi:replication factor C subunit 2/4